MPEPLLVLQPRRLGDLILTFPLLITLQKLFPAHPLWVMGQPGFYEPLLPFSPHAAYLPPSRLNELLSRQFATVINLGAGENEALFMGQCRAETKLGQISENGRLRVNGFWQLYRENLTHNNRHNAFHWADLFRMDLPLADFQRPSPEAPGSGRVGLFVGASEISKRPDALFWCELANRLAGMGKKPVLLGGPGDVAMSKAIMTKGARAANFCGKTGLAQLAALLRSLDLLITPDTGPMHLADWLSVPVLNLSMGNVNAAETGPLSPGQHVLQANMSCVGCWQCSRSRLFCKSAFTAAGVARVAGRLLEKSPRLTAPAGLQLLQTGRDGSGLYQLRRSNGARSSLDDFWKAAFLFFANPERKSWLEDAAGSLGAENAALAAHMRAGFGKMLASMAASRKQGKQLDAAFWRNQPLHSRMFAGFIQLSLQNSDFSSSAFAEALARIDALQAVLAG